MARVIGAYEAAFIQRTPHSRQLFEQARHHLAGGVAGNNKFMKPYPLYVREASGSRIVDVDGNRYIDLLMGAGPLILGHRPEPVIAAIQQQLERGTHFILPTELESDLAGKISRHMPYIEQLRFTVTGSEATIMALRVARAYTERDNVAKFDGHFHGHAHDSLSVNSVTYVGGPPHRPSPVRDWAGIPPSVLDTTLVLPFNETEAAVRLIRNHAQSLAAVILEPVPFTSLGGISPEPGFFEEVRRVTEDEGILLIFDEIITGFRLGLGGAGRYFGVTPDLVALGKIIGGGLPLGAYGGREDIMERVVTPTRRPSDEEEKIFQSGTFSANPVSLSAGIATITQLERADIYAVLRERTERLRSELRSTCEESGVEAHVTGVESMFHVHFTDTPIKNHADAKRADTAKNREFCIGLMMHGVFWPLLHGGFLSAAHSDEDIDLVVDAAREVLDSIGR